MAALFFFNGLSIMSLAPRTPDLKANLNINNGTFGTLLSSISIGSIVMLFIGGQAVDRFGAKLAIRSGSTIVALSFSILVHTKSSLVFLIACICAGTGIAMYHIAISGHSLHRQDEVGRVIIPKLHGAWGIGAMSTAAIAYIISNHVSIAWHITSLMVFTWLLTQYSITKLAPTFPPKSESNGPFQLTSVEQFSFKINWFLCLGFFCGSIVDFTIGDWATLFGKEELGMGASTATLSYLVYLIGIIIGRFSIGWALNHQSERFWIRTGGAVGGLGFISMLIFSTLIVDTDKTLAYTAAFLGFFLAGLGSSVMAPIFFTIAGRLLNGQNVIAVAQLSFMNAIAIFIAKTILAWIVQLTSITAALVLAGSAMFALIYFGKIGSNQQISVDLKFKQS